ncbi:hypothetical protein IGJ83_003202 [Enterococcus pernyi]
MKKLLISSLLFSSLFINNISVPVFAEEISMSTEVSVQLIKPVLSGHLPGIDDQSFDKPIIEIKDSADNEVLPKTNEQSSAISFSLGWLLIVCSWLLWKFSNRREEK